MPIFKKDVTHPLKYIEELSEEFARYVAQVVVNVFHGVLVNIGVKEPDKLATRRPKLLQKGFLSGLVGIGKKIKRYVGRKMKSPFKPFKILGKQIYLKGKPATVDEWNKFENQVTNYMKPYLDNAAEEMAVKGILLGLASSEAELQGKGAKQYGKKSYDQVEKENFVGYIPDSMMSVEERYDIDHEIGKAINLAHMRVGEYITNVEDDVREAIKQQVVDAHKKGKSYTELASDLYWMAEDKPELKEYSVEGILRDWARVAKTELAFIHEAGKMAANEIQVKKSIDDPDMAVYYVFNGSGRCDWCNDHLGTIVRHIPAEMARGNTDNLKELGIDDHYAEIAVWNGKSNIGRKKVDWWVCTPVHPWPFSEDTEVLADKGWKLIKDVNKDDLIFSLNIDDGYAEWAKYKNKYYNDYDGEMIHFKSPICDLLVTLNHATLIEHNNQIQILCADHVYEMKQEKIYMFTRNNYSDKNFIKFELKASEINKIKYKGKVACLYLEKNNTMLVKRNGKIVWSGNCADTFSRIYPEAQEYDKDSRRIRYKGNKDAEDKGFIPEDILKEIEGYEAENKARRDEMEADREEIHKKDKEYYEKKKEL